MPSYTVQHAETGDWQRVRDIRLRALEDSPDAFGSTLAREERWEPKVWKERLSNTEAATFLLAHPNGGDVGIAVGAPYTDREGAGLFSMWVAPEARGFRLGGQLIDAVIDWARAQGYQLLRLGVGDYNAAAIRLYERKGFEPSGRTGTLDPPREHITEHERVLTL